MRRTFIAPLLIVSTTLLVSLSTPALAKPESVIKASVKAPGYRVLQRLAKQGKQRFKAHGKGKALGGARYIEAVSSQRPRAVQLLIVEQVSGRWLLRHRLELGVADKPDKRCGVCDPDSQKTAGVVFVRDYDGDGKLEALARTITCWSQPAIGATTYRSMEIWNLDGKPRSAMSADYGYNALPTTAGAEHVRARFVDVDKDGHPDVVLLRRQEYPGQKTTREKKVYIWNAKTDRYTLRKRPKRRRKK
jgi:hypothetical protein